MPETTPAVTLRATGLSRSFGPRAAVCDVNLTLKRGEVLGFLGPNGAGKTTTMRMLTGNLAPSIGSVEICGIDLLEYPILAKARLGYLPEVPPLYRDLTVDDYLLLAARLHRIPRSGCGAAVARVKERCGLAAEGSRLIGSLSKGYQQRVGIAQAIVHNPDVVILDEPTVGLDPNQIRDIRALIRELGGSHSVILSTHILPEVEAVCDRVQILHQGRVIYDDSIKALEQMRRGESLTLGLRNPPAAAELEAVVGVARVDPLGEGEFRIHCTPGADPTAELVALAAAREWGLHHLTPSRVSLEEVFAQLTQENSAPPPSS